MHDETFDLTLEALADARDLARHAARACSSPRVLLLIRFKFTAVECRLLIRRLLLEVRVNEIYYNICELADGDWWCDGWDVASIAPRGVRVSLTHHARLSPRAISSLLGHLDVSSLRLPRRRRFLLLRVVNLVSLEAARVPQLLPRLLPRPRHPADPRQLRAVLHHRVLAELQSSVVLLALLVVLLALRVHRLPALAHDGWLAINSLRG